MFTTFDDNKEEIDLFINNKFPKGLGVGWDSTLSHNVGGGTIEQKRLDDYLVHKKGDFGLITGHNGVGKTAVFVFWVTALAVRHGVKSILYSCENYNSQLYVMIMEFFACKKIEHFTAKDIKESRAFMYEYFKIIDSTKKSYNYIDLMKSKKQWAEAEILFVDPLSKLDKFTGEIRGVNYAKLAAYDYTKKMVSDINAFKVSNNCSFWLSAHPTSSASRNRQDGKLMPPTDYDIDGGGALSNGADAAVVVHRDKDGDDPFTSEVHVKKVKFKKTGGAETHRDYPVRIKMISGGTGFVDDKNRNPIELSKQMYNDRHTTRQPQIT